jgi:DNA-binding IscR family transcriptional regulator
MVHISVSRRSEILRRHSETVLPIDGAQIAAAFQLNPVYVSQICNALAVPHLILRERGPSARS